MYVSVEKDFLSFETVYVKIFFKLNLEETQVGVWDDAQEINILNASDLLIGDYLWFCWWCYHCV